MAIAHEPFHYELDESEDETGWKTTTIRCHGKLVNRNADEIKDLIKPLIARGGRVVVDFADLEFLDSSCLGTLVGLKISAVNQGLCRLELVNLSARIRQLLKITNLQRLFSE